MNKNTKIKQIDNYKNNKQLHTHNLFKLILFPFLVVVFMLGWFLLNAAKRMQTE